ncbi:MAG: hypothetical protein AAFX05_01920 [Planctomycetota bacterium]
MRGWITTAAMLLCVTTLSSAQQSRDAAEPTLCKAVETRQTEWCEKDDDGFSSMGQRTGLTLTFDLNLPKGMKIASLDQPKRIEATDSEGTDLSEIEEGFSGREYVELPMSWSDEPTTQFTFNLGLTARRAETFSLRASVPANVYLRTEQVMLDVGSSRSAIDAGALEMNGVTAQMSVDGGMHQVTFQPGTVRDRVEAIELVRGGAVVAESTSSMWSDDSVTYFFDGDPGDGAEVRITVRRGSKTIPLRIDVKDVELP